MSTTHRASCWRAAEARISPHRRRGEQRSGASSGLVAASKSIPGFCGGGWQVEGKQRIVGHVGCGGKLTYEASRLHNELPCESPFSRRRHADLMPYVIRAKERQGPP